MQQVARVAQQVIALRPAQPGCLGKWAAHRLLQDHSWATALCQVEHSAVSLQRRRALLIACCMQHTIFSTRTALGKMLSAHDPRIC